MSTKVIVCSGAWLQARPHGRGVMEYKDGGRHSGLWRAGEPHGRGEYSGPAGERQVGSWTSGRLTGWATLQEPTGAQYSGEVVAGLPHGHGTRKEGSFLDQKIYIGAWVRGQRHGYGVQEDVRLGEKYLGLWSEGSRQGWGCAVNTDGVYYEGNWQAGRLAGSGLMLFEDGARYEGEFAGAGEFNGRGVLVAGGRRMIGTFHGNYAERMKFSGDIVAVGREEEEAGRGGAGVEPDLRWAELFRSWEEKLAGGPERAWEQLAVLISGAGGAGQAAELERCPGEMDTHALTTSSLAQLKQYLAGAAACPAHPLHALITRLSEAFTASYGGLRSHPTLLPLATAELASITSRLYSAVCLLFPVLPAVVAAPLEVGECWVSPASLLHPHLLPHLHPTLFMLYALREAKVKIISAMRGGFVVLTLHCSRTLSTGSGSCAGTSSRTRPCCSSWRWTRNSSCPTLRRTTETGTSTFSQPSTHCSRSRQHSLRTLSLR